MRVKVKLVAGQKAVLCPEARLYMYAAVCVCGEMVGVTGERGEERRGDERVRLGNVRNVSSSCRQSSGFGRDGRKG
jgi:hypothetical protein